MLNRTGLLYMSREFPYPGGMCISHHERNEDEGTGICELGGRNRKLRKSHDNLDGNYEMKCYGSPSPVRRQQFKPTTQLDGKRLLPKRTSKKEL